MAVELRTLTTAGTYSEILPDWFDLTFSQIVNAPGVLTFSYPGDGRNAELLVHGVHLVILLDGFEPRDARFIYDEGTGSLTAESDNGVRTYGCKSYLAQFAKMMIAPAIGSPNADPKMPDANFLNKSPGAILITAITNAMSRAATFGGAAAAVPWLQWPIPAYAANGTGGFSATTDASGTTWPVLYDVTFDPGTPVQDVLDYMAENGLGEASFQGRTLKFYLPEKNGTDRSSGTNMIVLMTGRDFTEASYETTSVELVNSVMVIGDAPPATTAVPNPSPAVVWVSDAASIAQYGYKEGALRLGLASTPALLTAAGNAYLTQNKRARWAYTYAVSALYLDTSYTEDADFSTPYVDYQAGDTILTLDAEKAQPFRLMVLTATYPNSRAASVNLTVNDFFQSRDAQLERRMARLSSGLPG